jgi:hypothetical protein
VIGLADLPGVVEHGVGRAGDAAAIELVERAPRTQADRAVGGEPVAALERDHGGPGQRAEPAVDGQRRRGAVLVEPGLQVLDLGAARPLVQHRMSRRAILDPPLHRRAAARTAARGARDGVEQVDRRVTCDHARRDLIGVLLVAVADLANAAVDADPGALLHDVRRLVGGGEQAGLSCERHAVARRERLGAHRARPVGRGAVGVRRDARHVVVAEAALDVGLPFIPPWYVWQAANFHVDQRSQRRAASRQSTGLVLNAIAAPGACWRTRWITRSNSSTAGSCLRMPPPITTTA